MIHRPDKPMASVVVPCLNEEGTLEAFCERVKPVLDDLFENWEIVFVDDGSTDRTPALLRELHSRDERLRGLCLSRNFGSHVAIAAGLDHVRGDVAVIMAADLQDPPEVIPELLAKWREGYEIVWAARDAREDPFLRRVLARIFYGLVARMALPGTPRTGTGSFSLLDRTVVEAFRRFEERNRLTFGIVAWTGFAQTQVPYTRAARHAGQSKWSASLLVKAGIDTFVSFSYIPLRFISYFGMTVSVLAFLFGCYVVVDYLLNGVGLRGWPSLMAAILFLGGAQLITLGIIGEYLWRVSEEAKRRPLYLVRDRVGVEQEEATALTALERP
jgi:glycosyltransferase involved in cell wall biosynthesis